MKLAAKREWLAEIQSFTVKNDTMTLYRVTDGIVLLMISRYHPTDLSNKMQGQRKSPSRLWRDEKTEYHPENGDDFVHVWSGVVGQSDKAAVDISMYLGLMNPNLFDWW